MDDDEQSGAVRDREAIPQDQPASRPNLLGRTLTWVGTQAAFLAVLIALAAGFGYLLVQSEHWRRATGLIAVGVLLAGVLRAALPSHRVGLLAVRARWLDTVLYLGCGGLILALDIRLHT